MHLKQDARLGPYQILALLGAGGMGEVYRARDMRLGRDVAVKVLPVEFARDPERLRRFEQEARAAAALNHPNLLVLYDIGSVAVSRRGAEGPVVMSTTPPRLPRTLRGLAMTEERGDVLHYLVTELLEGETLRQRMAAGPLPPSKTVEISVQVAQGLAAAHEKGIVHRDLKPENLFITKDGRIKILDFGLARLTQHEAARQESGSQSLTVDSPTREGVILGTPGYMAPEQVRGLTADARSDMFAFGCVLYEMIAGRRAFEGFTSSDVLASVLKEDPPDLMTLAPKTPPILAQLVKRCLEKRPEDRLSSARDAAFALEAGTRSGGVLRGSTPRAPLGASRGTVVALGAALLAIVTAAGILTWNSWKMKPGRTGTVAGEAPSLVVLPCKVFGAPESAYLADAVPNTLSTILGEANGLDTRVPPTIFEVEKVQGDFSKIAAAYGVQALVVTTVTVEGGRFLLNVQLADAKTRKVRWSHQYQGSRESYTDLAREAAQGICKAVLPEATPAVTVSGRAADAESELAFQQGRYYTSRYLGHNDRADFDRAAAAFNRVMERNPNDAEAAAMMAALYFLGTYGGHVPRAQALAAGEAWTQKALALDPRSSQAWTSRALLEAWQSNARMDKQIEWSLRGAYLGPNNPSAQMTLGVLGLSTAGAMTLGVEAARESLRLNPLNFIAYVQVGLQLAALGRTKEALRVMDTVLALDPGNGLALVTKGYVLLDAGRTKESAALLQQCIESHGASGGLAPTNLAIWKAELVLTGGDDQQARAALQATMAAFADPAQDWNTLQDMLLVLPLVNHRFGKDAALDLLVLAAKRGATMPYDVLMLRSDLKDLREDPRAKDVVQKTKVPFEILIRVLQGARSRDELPAYLEKPMDDLVARLKEQDA